MKDAFGVERTDISKGLRLDKFARSKVGQKILTDAPLKPNEFWHGTTASAAEKIKNEGFSLRLGLGRHRRHFGPGVYGTKTRGSADNYANNSARMKGGEGHVLRVAHAKKTRLMQVKDWDNTIKTPQATRAGFAGITSDLMDGGAKHNILVVANPRNVKVVPNRYRITLRLRNPDQMRPTKAQLALKDQMRRSKP